MELGESVAVGVLAVQAEDDREELVSCAWRDCKTTHIREPVYPVDGVLSRSAGFAASWVSAGLEPWVKYGPGVNSFATIADFRAETPKAAHAFAAAALKHPEYHTQKHHLIPINLSPSARHLMPGSSPWRPEGSARCTGYGRTSQPATTKR